jgi:hypothetical protein
MRALAWGWLVFWQSDTGVVNGVVVANIIDRNSSVSRSYCTTCFFFGCFLSAGAFARTLVY